MDVPLSTSTALATRDDELFSADEQLALAGFLAGYSGLTRDAYTLDLRQYVAWCTEYWYTTDDRVAQLRRLAETCRKIVELFDLHAHRATAHAYFGVARTADTLVERAADLDELKALAATVPDGPDWLNPKCIDAFDGAIEAWQAEVAALHSVARKTALELRALATYDRT